MGGAADCFGFLQTVYIFCRRKVTIVTRGPSRIAGPRIKRFPRTNCFTVMPISARKFRARGAVTLGNWPAPELSLPRLMLPCAAPRHGVASYRVSRPRLYKSRSLVSRMAIIAFLSAQRNTTMIVSRGRSRRRCSRREAHSGELTRQIQNRIAVLFHIPSHSQQ